MSEKDELIGYFREIQTKATRLYARILTQADITLPQFALLTLLVSRENLSMTEVSEKLFISKPAVTNLVDRLEKHECLKRIPSPGDRRVYLLQVLPKGEEIVRKTQCQFFNFLLTTLKSFKSNDRKLIIRFYSLLAKTIGEEMTHCKKAS